MPSHSSHSLTGKAQNSVWPNFKAIVPLFVITFSAYLAVTIPLTVFPFYVTSQLNFGPVIAGLVISAQSAVTILSRHYAGKICDRNGPCMGVTVGILVGFLSLSIYLFSLIFLTTPWISLMVLFLGRLAMGFAESFFLTCAQTWAIYRAGSDKTGLVMSWHGIAMYSSFAVGTPVGIGLYFTFGIASVFVLAASGLFVSAAISAAIKNVTPPKFLEARFFEVIGCVWRPGLVVTLAAAPFSILGTFLALYFRDEGWQHDSLAFIGFGAGYIFVRLFFANCPSRFGGFRVASISLAVEVLGQVFLWGASDSNLAIFGAILTGAGFSLIFPSMGIEATRRANPLLLGRTIGVFNSSVDVSFFITPPLIGWVIVEFSYRAAFFSGGFLVAAALIQLMVVYRYSVQNREPSFKI